MFEQCKQLEVDAGVRYWEDGVVNGVEDEAGALIPGRGGEHGERWQIVIDLETGKVRDWPEHTIANVHYKVCDDGEYWLRDEEGKRIYKWAGDYVPNALLCPQTQGWGDYIIMNIDEMGQIAGWNPRLNGDDWVAV